MKKLFNNPDDIKINHLKATEKRLKIGSFLCTGFSQ